MLNTLFQNFCRLLLIILVTGILIPHPTIAREYLDEESIITIESEAEEYEPKKYDIPEPFVDPVDPYQESDEEEDDDPQSAYEEYKDKLYQLFGSQKAYIQHRIRDLEKELNINEDNFEDTSTEIKDITRKIEPLKEKIVSLKTHIDLINGELYLTHIKIKHATRQIKKKEDEISVLIKDIKNEGLKLKDHREKLKRYARLMYKEEKQFLNFSSTKPSIIKLLLSDESFGAAFLKIAYFKAISKQIESTMYNYEIAKKNLIDKETILEKHKSKLVTLNYILNREQANLRLQSESQKSLLAATKGEEIRYKQLLSQTREEQANVVKEIEKLENNVAFFEQKLKQNAQRQQDLALLQFDDYDESSFESVITKEYENFFELSDNAPLRWPVIPKRGISAYFRDPTYPYISQIGHHHAIDIPTLQGTPVHAPRAAVVGKIKTSEDISDTSYHYLILIHGNNIMTVYGHVTEVLVEEGDLVQEGDIIALTGGQIGTKGAGWATTGPHLHFEVYKNGKHVDPLDYLPLNELRDEFIPAKYKNKPEESVVEDVVEGN